jgi:cation transport ATPase
MNDANLHCSGMVGSEEKDTVRSVTLMITLFVVACPDALVLATPVAITVATGLGARNGILFKSAVGLEAAARLTVVVLDTTRVDRKLLLVK